MTRNALPVSTTWVATSTEMVGSPGCLCLLTGDPGPMSTRFRIIW